MKTYIKMTEAPSCSTLLPLTHEQRLKSRLHLTLSASEGISIVLPRGVRLKSGVCLEADDGSIVKIVSATEDLSFIKASGLALARACYHLGNRHLPASIQPEGVYYGQDSVIDDMMRGLGFDVEHHRAVFEPEPGAYHGHAHTNGAVLSPGAH